MALEREVDRNFQKEMAKHLASVWSVNMLAAPPFEAWDFTADRGGEVLALVEVKNRDGMPPSANTIFLSMRKWAAIELARQQFGLPGLFVFRHPTKGILWFYIAEAKPLSKIVVRGRKDRGLHNDMEAIIEVPLSMCRTLAETPTCFPKMAKPPTPEESPAVVAAQTLLGAKIVDVKPKPEQAEPDRAPLVDADLIALDKPETEAQRLHRDNRVMKFDRLF